MGDCTTHQKAARSCHLFAIIGHTSFTHDVRFLVSLGNNSLMIFLDLEFGIISQTAGKFVAANLLSRVPQQGRSEFMVTTNCVILDVN